GRAKARDAGEIESETRRLRPDLRAARCGAPHSTLLRRSGAHSPRRAHRAYRITSRTVGTASGSPNAVYMRHATYCLEGAGRNGACRNQSRRRNRHATVSRSRASGGFTIAWSTSEIAMDSHFIVGKIAGREAAINSPSTRQRAESPPGDRFRTPFSTHVALPRLAGHQQPRLPRLLPVDGGRRARGRGRSRAAGRQPHDLAEGPAARGGRRETEV